MPKQFKTIRIMEKQNFNITVWFRYSVAGEVEKDFEVYKILADNVQEAVNEVNSMYTSKSKIPFCFSCEGVDFKPTNLTMTNLFTLTNPL